MTDYCDFIDCDGEAITIVREGKHVCLIHAAIYQKDVAERMTRDGDTLH